MNSGSVTETWSSSEYQIVVAVDRPRSGQLQPFTSSKIHAGTDRSQGAEDVARCRKRGERSPKQTVRDWGRKQA